MEGIIKKSGTFDVDNNFLDQASDPILILDKKGQILKINKIALQLIGYKSRDIENKNIIELKMLTPKSKIIVLKNFAKRMLGKKIKPYTVDLITKNKKIINVEINASPIKEKNKIIGDFVIIRDYTEKRIQEENLRKTNELLEKIFLSIDSAIFILDNRVPPIILKCNAAAMKIFGYKEREMIGKTTEFLHVNKNHLLDFEKALFPIINAKKKFSGFEFEMKRKNGQIFPTSHTVIPLFEQGKRSGWVSVVQDISERKRNEKILRENEEKYKNFLDNSIDLIQMVNAKGRFIYVNKKWCETLGYSQDEAFGMKFTEIIKKTELHHCLQIFNRILYGESVNNVETIFMTKFGKQINVLGSINSIKENGKFVSTLGSFQDISRLKKRQEFQEEYLQEVEKMNRLMVGRELKMIELKEKIKLLENKLANKGSNNVI